MILYDSALTLPEQDRLGRKGFARFLAQSILRMDASEPFVFALQGSWGSGKSTVLNFVRFFLENPNLLGDTYSDLPPILIVNFNPWWFSGSDQLLADFFRQFRIQIGRQPDPSGKLKALSVKLDLFARILTPITWIPTVAPIAERVKKSLEWAAAAVGNAAETKELDANQAKQDISDLLAQQESRILVVLDDLDRLRPDELRQIFQVVKAVADFPKTIYLLSYDRTAVGEALEKAGVHSPAQYLEKIVQAPFDLPEPDWLGLRNVTAEHIEKLISETPKELWDEKRWNQFYFGGLDVLLRGPRDINRLFNILRPAYPPVRGEVDLLDFIAIHAIRIFAPSVFRFIANNKGMMTNSELKFLFDEEAEKESRRQIMNNVLDGAEADRNAVNTILETMFPVWDTRVGRGTFSDDSQRRWRKARRICSVDVFDFFFRLSVPEGSLPSSEVKAILALSNKPSEFCAILNRLAAENAFDGTTKLEKFLQYSRDYLPDGEDGVSIEGLVASVCNCGDTLYNKLERQMLPFSSTDWQLFRFMEAAISKISDSAARLKLVTDAFVRGSALSVITLAADVWMEKAKRQHDASDPPLFDADQSSAIAEVVLERIEAASADGSLRQTPYLDRVLIFWAARVGPERIRSYGEALTKDQTGLADLIVGALSGVTLSSSGERFRSTPNFVEECTALSADSIATQCDAWLADEPPWMTELRRVAIQAFSDAVRRPFDEFGFRRGL